MIFDHSRLLKAPLHGGMYTLGWWNGFVLITLLIILYLWKIIIKKTSDLDAKKSQYMTLHNNGLQKLRKHDYKDAIGDFDNAIKLGEKINIALPETYYNRGLSKYYIKDYNGSFEDCSTAIKIISDDYDSLVLRGLANQGLNRNTEAISDYSSAIKINPNNSEAYCKRGKAKYDQNDINGAISDYNNAVKLDPKSAEAIANRAVTKSDLQDHQGSIDEYSLAIELNPAFIAGLYFNRGLEKKKLKNQKGALADIKKASELGSTEAIEYLHKD
jgi:tetratricopeptide (TPR) repeat protein